MSDQTHSDYPSIRSPLDTAPDVYPAAPCPYYAERQQKVRAYLYQKKLPPETFEALLNAGYRRSGRAVYQQICRGCRECTPLRVPVGAFSASTSQRRWMRRNADLAVKVQRPRASAEVRELYARYLRDWHGRDDPADATGIDGFLYDSPVPTLEFRYRDASGRLLAVGICDITPRVLSSVYFFFDPAEAARRLGTFGALTEIQYARTAGLEYYHLGFWVKGCAAMAYKASFSPYQLLGTDGVWRDAL